MTQEGRNERGPENLRLSHRSRNRIQPGGGTGHQAGVSEIPGAQQAARRQQAGGQQAARRPQGVGGPQAGSQQPLRRPQGAGGPQTGSQQPARRPQGAANQKAGGQQPARRPQGAGGPQAGGRQGTQRPQNTRAAQTFGNPQTGRGLQVSEQPGGRGSSEARWARWEEEKFRRQKEEAEQRRKQKKIVIIALAAAAAVLAAALILWLVFGKKGDSSEPAAATQDPQANSAASDDKLTDADFPFTVPAEKQEAGTANIEKEVADYEGYAIRYPVMGNETVDGAIAQRVDDMASVFKRQVQSMRTDGRTRMTMTGDYEAYQTGEALVSVKFNIHKELPQAGEAGDSIETYTYRLSDGAELALSDVLTEGYLELLSGKTKEFAQAQGGTLREGAAEAADANFRYYTWNEDGLTLYFPGGTLIDGASEVLSFTIPMEELSGYLAMDLGGGGGSEPEGQAAQADVAGRVDPSKPMVCLTFDDGPKASTTSELLDILEENDARATFFVVGDALKGSSAEDIVRREVELGCQVGNHTANHKNFREISDEEIESQIEGVNDVLTGWGLPAANLVRPPYGGWNNHVRDVVKYPMARWNVDTLDWETRDPEATIQCVLYDEKKKAADGDIILMHDIHAETIEACRTIIPELKARGFQLVTMEEMFAAKGIPYEAGKVYYSSGDVRTDFGE